MKNYCKVKGVSGMKYIPEMSDEEIEEKATEYINLPISVFGEVTDGYILKASGNGMRRAGILDGDYLLFDSSFEPKSGDIVHATVNGEPMCRRYLFRDGKHYFRREDGKSGDIIPDDFAIHGVMVNLIRNYRGIEYADEPDA